MQQVARSVESNLMTVEIPILQLSLLKFRISLSSLHALQATQVNVKQLVREEMIMSDYSTATRIPGTWQVVIVLKVHWKRHANPKPSSASNTQYARIDRRDRVLLPELQQNTHHSVYCL